MTAPISAELDQSVSPDDVIRELESQLGMAAGQLTRFALLLRRRDEQLTERDEQIRYLTEQIAQRDAAVAEV
jgi:hypothetical protein